MDKLVVGVFGKINSGKSTLVNSLARENISIVSEVRGSTSDAVSKMTEIDGIGRVQLIDTAGYDDISALANERLISTEKAFNSSDIVIIVCSETLDDIDKLWIEKCKKCSKKYLLCRNLKDCEFSLKSENEIIIDAKNIKHIDSVVKKIKELSSVCENDLLGNLVKAGDIVLLCVPQDDGAPNGRLILPQSVTIRGILDKGGSPIVADKNNFEILYEKFAKDISLVITDSSVFDMVYKVVGGDVPITSFSVLFAKYNGDINVLIDGAKSIDNLNDGDKVLIMEACSHTLSHKDIGSVLIPNLIKKYTGKNIIFDFIRGKDEPVNIAEYKLVVHCGGCTQNKQFMMSRINKCKQNNVPITNYGIIIAKIKGILDKIVF